MGHSSHNPADVSLPPNQNVRRPPAPLRGFARIRAALPGQADNAYKIAVEVAGTDLESCGCGYIMAAAVKDATGRVADHQKVKPLTNAGQDMHRCEVELRGLTGEARPLYIRTGCHEAADGACLIPLQRDARPVPADTRTSSWPTVLIPVVPMAYGDEANSRAKARRLRNGWLYIYINGHLWRELYVTERGLFRDVNLGLTHVAGRDVREPCGHAMSAVLVPHTIAGQKQTVQLAFAEVQWPWQTVCAMGGPADDDMRFLPQVIAAARRIALDGPRRTRRFVTLDFSGYPDRLDSADGIVGPIHSAPGTDDPGSDPLAAVRHKKIAAVYLQDPLRIARDLAGQYQQSWRDMQTLLAKLARAPKTALKKKTYDPGRWFDSAVLANNFFFGPFPDYASWQKLHPAADQKAWQKAKNQHTRMQACLDKQAIDQALGVKQRQGLRPKIEKTRQRLLDFLQARTKDTLDLLVLMLDDYFTLPNTAGQENTPGCNPCGYADGWGVAEQLIARLGDHSFTQDADLEAEPVDTARLTRDNPGIAFLNRLADPDQNHPWHARLFPRPAADPLTPDTTPADEHSPVFKPQRFKNASLADMGPVAGFISHFAKSALAAGHPGIRHSLVRLANATCKLELEQTRMNGEDLERHAVDHQRSCEQRLTDLQSAAGDSLTACQLAGLMRGWSLFAKSATVKNINEAQAAKRDDFSLNGTVAPLKPVNHAPLRWRLTTDDLRDWQIDQIVSARSARVKEPIPNSTLGYITFPQSGPATLLQLVTPPGKIIGRPTIADLRQGKMSACQWSRPHHKTPWHKTEVELLISRDPGLFARLCKQMKDRDIVKRVIIPMAMVFETWNFHLTFSALTEKISPDETIKALGNTVGAIFDSSALCTTQIFQRVAVASEIQTGSSETRDNEMPPFWRSRVGLFGPSDGVLGVMGGSHSACRSAADILNDLRRSSEIDASQDIMMWDFFWSASYDTAWTISFFADAKDETACPPAWAIAQGPLLWISLGGVLAALARHIFVFRKDTPLEEWLAKGPFGVKNPSGRFAGHRPGDTDWGPPPGGEQRQQNYPGTIRQMTFWKEPDGSFLWIDKDGLIADSRILPGGRLSLEGHTIYLKTTDEKVMLGQKGGPIRNRNKLPVDRKDNGNRFRRWCEQPVSAYHDLAAMLFTPAVEMEFSRWPRQDIKYPTANPFIGWDYFVHVHIVLPHFIEDKSRLYVELWETVDGKPHLTYDARITMALDENLGTRQLTLTWPLAPVYCRSTEVNAKVKLDLFGDSRLCLPVKDPQKEESADWIIKSRQMERKPVTGNPDYYGYR